MSADREHLWLVGPRRVYREGAALSLVSPDARVDCHSRVRGPYSGMNLILRSAVVEAQSRWPDLVADHRTEIVSMAPELSGLLGVDIETLMSSPSHREATSFHEVDRTRCLAHGIAGFFSEFSARRGRPALVLSMENVHAADPIEQELIAILLRELVPSRVRLVVGTSEEQLPDELDAALSGYARRIDIGFSDPVRRDRVGPDVLVEAYIRADGVGDNPLEHEAYQKADPARRALAHDARARELEKIGETSLRLGAIPWHLEHGSDPAGRGAEALHWAARYCLRMGLYPAVLDYGMRARAAVDPDRQPELCSEISETLTTAMALLEQGDMTEPVCV